MISIELTDEQARAFRLLSEIGAWDLVNGSVTLHFSQRKPMRIEKREVLTSYPQPAEQEIRQVVKVVL